MTLSVKDLDHSDAWNLRLIDGFPEESDVEAGGMRDLCAMRAENYVIYSTRFLYEKKAGDPIKWLALCMSELIMWWMLGFDFWLISCTWNIIRLRVPVGVFGIGSAELLIPVVRRTRGSSLLLTADNWGG